MLSALALLLANVTADWVPGDAVQLYFPTAENIRAHGAYSVMTTPPYLPTIVKMPGYSALLAVIESVGGNGLRPIQVTQFGLVALTALVAAHAARRLFDERVGLLAGVLVAAYPGLAVHAMQPLSETLTALLLTVHTAALLTLVGKPDRATGAICSAAVTLGGLVLVRQSFAALLPLVSIGLVVALRSQGWRHALRAAGLLTLISTAVFLPWCVRNIIVSDQFLPFGANSGMSLLVSVRQYAESDRAPVFYVESVREQTRLVDEELGAPTGAARDLDQGLGGGPRREAAVDARLSALARAEAAQLDPLRAAAKVPARLIDQWSGTTSIPALDAVESLLMAAVAAAIVVVRRRWRQLWPILLPAAYLSILHLVFHTEARYTLPARPALLIALAAVLGGIGHQRSSRRADPVVDPGETTAVGLLLDGGFARLRRCWSPSTSSRSQRENDRTG